MEKIEQGKLDELLKNFDVMELEERMEFAEWGWVCEDIIDPATGQVIGRQCGVRIPI